MIEFRVLQIGLKDMSELPMFVEIDNSELNIMVIIKDSFSVNEFLHGLSVVFCPVFVDEIEMFVEIR